MKQIFNFRFLKSLLVLIGVLLTSLTTQMWAGAGYYQESGKAIQLCFWCNGADVWKDVASSQASAGDLGTVSTLYLKKFYVYVWQDGGTGISWTKLHWKIYKESDGTTDGNGWTDTSGSWIQDMGGNNKKYGIDSDAGINCLAGLEPGETYIFAYCINTDNVGWQSNGGWFAQRFTVADSKTTFETGKYIYIDARDNSSWKAADFTARFYFKRYDTGVDVANVTCANTNKLENWVYYAAVPEGSYIGKVNVDRVNPENINSEKWCYTNVIAASSRSSAYENCLYKSQDWCNGWSPDWTTYCPPMSSATLSNNSTSVIPWTSGNGTSGNPYLVPASGGTIKVSGSATKAVPDNNMTINYDFKVNGSSAQAGTSNTFNKTSLSNNTTYTITMDAYNAYNGATGTKYTASQTLYYKALSTYTITNSLTNMTSTGRSGAGAAAYNIAYTATLSAATGYNLPSTITVARGATTLTAGTHYTYNSSTGTLSINADQVTGNITITAAGVAKTYEDGVLDKVDGTTSGEYSVIFHDTKITVVSDPVKAGYQVDGYYLYNSGADYSHRIAEPNGSLNANITYNTVPYTDADGNWIYDDIPTLYTKWTPKTYTITLDANRGGIPGTDGSANFTAIFGASDYSSRTMPTREGYTFAGYWTDPSSGVQVLTSPNGGINADVSGYTDEDGKWTNASDDLTLYAHWTDNGTYVFKGGASGNETSWSIAANWTKGVAPSANNGSEDIIILAPVRIPASATTYVNSVRIGTAGSYTPVGGSAIPAAGKLTVPATAMLKVTTNVQNYNVSTSEVSATTESTLHIESASTGNGALVWGAASSTPGRAQVDFYTKSSAAGTWTGDETDVNQYIGTPFSDASVLYNYYNAWTFKVNAAGDDWERMNGDETMYPFVGYDVIYDGAAGHIFEMDGTLVTNDNKTCTLSHTTAGDENLLANSWTAPMWIKGFAVGDFTNANAAIYIFKSTSEKATEEAGYDEDVTGGNYETFTPGTSGTDAYIPSMQSFSVLSSGGAGSVTLNYTNLVLNPASHTHIGAMYAPRRFADGETEPEENLEPKMDFLRLRVADTNGWADELKIYIREDFVEEFENGFDARKMYGDDRAPMLYGISPDGRMAINCIPTADNHVVGFHGGSASNEYTFRFAYDGEEELYLLDNKTGAETLISAEDTYSFTTEAGDNDLRFSIIRKTPAVPTDIETVTGEGLQTTGVQKIMYNGMLYILRSGRIYDATGALVK